MSKILLSLVGMILLVTAEPNYSPIKVTLKPLKEANDPRTLVASVPSGKWSDIVPVVDPPIPPVVRETRRDGMARSTSSTRDQGSQDRDGNRLKGLQICQEKWSVEECQALDSLVMSESGWNINAINKSSGACGIGQAYPCSKISDIRGDFRAETEWTINYSVSRYGSLQNAYRFKINNNWY